MFGFFKFDLLLGMNLFGWKVLINSDHWLGLVWLGQHACCGCNLR